MVVEQVVKTVYRGLVVESVTPAEPRKVGAAALAAIARARGTEQPAALPPSFGADVDADTNWLAARVAEVDSPWPILQAMVFASGKAHTAVMKPAPGGLRALFGGNPSATPGFHVQRAEDGRLLVRDLVPGASAERAGLRQGDALLAIDGGPLRATQTLHVLYAADAGKTFTLDVERDGARRAIAYTSIKADVPLVVGKMIGRQAHVHVRWFSDSPEPERSTGAAFERVLRELLAKDPQGLILDLRGNLGGNDKAMTTVASLLSDGDPLFVLQSPDGKETPLARSRERLWPGRPIVALVDDQTLSAGEYVPLTLRELAGAKVVGRPTAGGLNEAKVTPLAEGWMFMLPVAHAVGPRTKKVNVGCVLVPDVEVRPLTIADLIEGRDPQIDAASKVLAAFSA